MPTYRVKLSASAFVEQTQEIFCSNPDEARQIALDEYNDHVWKYVDIFEETVEINDVYTVLETCENDCRKCNT